MKISVQSLKFKSKVRLNSMVFNSLRDLTVML